MEWRRLELIYGTTLVIWMPDIIGHVTIRLSIGDLIYILNRNQTRISLLGFEIVRVKNYNFMTSLLTS